MQTLHKILDIINWGCIINKISDHRINTNLALPGSRMKRAWILIDTRSFCKSLINLFWLLQDWDCLRLLNR